MARPGLAHRPLPGGMAQLQSYDAVVIDTVASLGASAFMSGVGGDNVFHLTRSARPLVDRLLTVGPTLNWADRGRKSLMPLIYSRGALADKREGAINIAGSRSETHRPTPRASCRRRPGCPRARCASPAARSPSRATPRSEEHTSELQSLMRSSYTVFCLKKKQINNTN